MPRAGVLALIDEGEVDWKVVGVHAANPVASLLNDAGDVANSMPGTETAIREWFRNYKTADGKPQNTFGFNEKVR